MIHDIDAAKAAYSSSRGDIAAIPHGLYCYVRTGVDHGLDGLPTLEVRPCPYWASHKVGGEVFGWCAHLGKGDADGTLLLHDMVKECGIADELDDVEKEETNG